MQRMKIKKLLDNLENLIESNYGYLLFQAIESSKCELSHGPLLPHLFQ